MDSGAVADCNKVYCGFKATTENYFSSGRINSKNRLAQVQMQDALHATYCSYTYCAYCVADVG